MLDLDPSSRLIQSSYGSHKSIIDHICNIWARIPICEFCKLEDLILGNCHFVLLNDSLQHGESSLDVRKWDIDSFLKSPSDCWIQSPRQVGCSKYQNFFALVSHTLHLNQELSLYSSGNFILIWWSFTCNGVDLINKYDAWLLLSSHGKKTLESLLWLPNVFWHQVWCRNTEKRSTTHFSRTCLG